MIKKGWIKADGDGNQFLSDDGSYKSTGLVRQAKVTLTRSQILALDSTPIEIIAAPGSGKAILIKTITGRSGATNLYDGQFNLRFGTEALGAFTPWSSCSDLETFLTTYPSYTNYAYENTNYNIYATSAITDSGTSDSFELWIEYTIIDL